MKYSILHISDIHKAQGITYDALLQTLERDLISFTETEGIMKPSFVVISGDIIQGAHTDEEIRKQYAEAEDFLTKLCGLYLDNEKERLIIVPGNHDVNRARSKASMKESSSSPVESCKAYFEGSNQIRWSWKDFKFHEIHDQELYNSRFELFIEFYNRFYYGIRCYPNDPEHEAYCVRNDKYKVLFACFNSCNQLDDLCVTGSIPEEAVFSVGNELNDSYNSGYLNIAVWHHHFYGSPLTTNYMDRSFLTYLLNANVQIGLFGHQHYAQVAEEYTDLELYKDELLQKLLLISSGTLFGGAKELAPGQNRQYNIIEIEHSNGNAKVSIGIREDKNPRKGNLIPFWHPKALQTADNRIVRDVKLRTLSIEKQLLEIDKKLRKDNDFISACEAVNLLDLDPDKKYKLWFEYLSKVEDSFYVYGQLQHVSNVEEAMLKITTAMKIGKPELFQELLQDNSLVELNDSNVNDLLDLIKRQ